MTKATRGAAKGARTNSHIRELSRDEAWKLIDERARRHLQVDVAEFIRRWQGGEYGNPDDTPDALKIATLLPMIGIDPWRDGR